MPNQERNKPEYWNLHNQTDDSTESGDESGTEGQAGGADSHIAFHDFISSGEHLRDDTLPESEKKRLLLVHGEGNELNVRKQKEKRDALHAVKERKSSVTQYRGQYGQGGERDSQYPLHPILGQAAQFSGTDRQVNPSPTENLSTANEDQRQEYQYRYQLEYQPKFVAKPVLRSTPRLTK